MKYISNFSGGLCSFWAAHRIVEKYGPLDTVLLFADTLVEDSDLYRFNAHTSRILGVPITRVSLELTPWQLFRREGLIGNTRFPICSTKLKREPLNQWMATHFELDARQDNFLLEPATVVLGFDWTEHHRVTEFQAEHPTWRVIAPMTEEPIWDKCRMQKEADDLGIKIPWLYRAGFPHNNCGGRCVRAGISHWVHLLKVRRQAFLDWENEEQDAADEFRARGIEPMAMLRDRRGGTTKPLYLRDLRLRVENGEEFDRDDWGGCGCGGATS